MSTIKDEMTERVAQAIKDRREQLGLTLRELAARSGVSSSMISDVERAAKSPTIATLSSLAQALGVPISGLVEQSIAPAGRIQVMRAAERSEPADPKTGTRRDSFRPAVIASKLEFSRYTIPPRAIAGPFAAHAKGTIEHMYVAAGGVRAVFGTDAAMLEAGDFCTCLADARHHFDNSKGRVKALLFVVLERP
jgi:transcriptional regulator with XRE-family HTH domain